MSNESPQDVFFDNVTVQHHRGPLLGEGHYYPFGLAMSGINSQAAGKLENKLKYNKGSELQNKEFSDGSGLESYFTEFRMLDPQIGRWWQIDPKCEIGINADVAENENFQNESEVGGIEHQSPYMSMGDDPIRHNDPKGDFALIDNLVGAVVGAVVEIGSQVVTNAIEGKGFKVDSWGKVGVAAVSGFLTDGVGSVGKVAVKLGSALANSIIDNHKNGFGAVLKGTVENIATDAVVGKVVKVAKGVDAKTLGTVATNTVGSKNALTKFVKATGVDTRTARAVAKVLQDGEKAVAKQVIREAPTKAGEIAASAGADLAKKKMLNEKE